MRSKKLWFKLYTNQNKKYYIFKKATVRSLIPVHTTKTVNVFLDTIGQEIKHKKGQKTGKFEMLFFAFASEMLRKLSDHPEITGMRRNWYPGVFRVGECKPDVEIHVRELSVTSSPGVLWIRSIL